jgi:LysM repeat protein
MPISLPSHTWRIVCAALAAVVLVVVQQPASQPLLAAPPRQGTFYTVAEGDTWAEIAARYQTPLMVLWRANGVTNPTHLRSGLRLYIPSSGAAQPTAATLSVSPGQPFWHSAVTSGNSASTILLLNGWDNPVDAIGQPITALDRRTVAPKPSRRQPRPRRRHLRWWKIRHPSVGFLRARCTDHGSESKAISPYPTKSV